MLIHTESILKSKKIIKYNYFFLEHFKQEVQGLISRLFIQSTRRPSYIMSGLIQPLLWLLLFGALFRNIPLNLFHIKSQYNQFLSCGILIFTCFTGSLNTGLPLMFDREFGFLNRLLVSPLRSKSAIILATILFIVCITMLQNCVILAFSLKSLAHHLNLYKIIIITYISILITITISSISLALAFILPGHIEFLACILVINLPTLFTSTALAPIYLMPYWLQIISKLNILTYAIEALRFITINESLQESIIEIFNLNFHLIHILTLLLLMCLFSLTTITKIVHDKLE